MLYQLIVLCVIMLHYSILHDCYSCYYICIHIHMFVCVYIYIYIYIHTYIHAYVYIYIYIHSHKYNDEFYDILPDAERAAGEEGGAFPARRGGDIYIYIYTQMYT